MRSFWVSALLGFIGIMPYWIYHGLAVAITACMYVTIRSRKRHALESLAIAYGDAMSPREKERIARASFFSLTLGLADDILFIARSGRAAEVFTLEGAEHLRRAKEAGHGAVVAIAHFGPFAAMLFKFIFEGYPVCIVMKPPRGKMLRDDLLARATMATPRPIYSTPVSACVKECFQAFARNEVVAMPIDQNYGGDGRVFVDFFGRKASTAAGPAAFALKSGAALLIAFAEPSGPERWNIRVEPVAVDRAADPKKEARRLTQALTSRLEAEIRKFPGEWAWMHRRWKTVPKEGEIV